MAKNHLKRLAVPKSWPLARKKTKFTTCVRPGTHGGDEAIPLTTLLRELTRHARTSKEVKYLLRANHVLVGNKRRMDHTFTVGLLEPLTFTESKEHFRLVFDKLGKLTCISVDEKDAKTVVGKILSMGSAPKGKYQYNLYGGRNVLVDKQNKDYRVGDSLVLDENNKIVKHLPLKKGALVYFTKGKFQGTTATVDEIQGKSILVTNADETAQTLTSYAYVVGEKTPVIKLA